MTDREVRLTGVGAKQLDLRPARTLAPAEGGWEDLRTRWRHQLIALGEEFRQGIAVAHPATAETCRYCHLQTFCRIGEGINQQPQVDTVVEDSE
jgi:hypothetical protein